MDEIIKYCQISRRNKADTCNVVKYNKLQTSTNNPNISTRMRYSQYVNTATPSKNTYVSYTQNYGVLAPPVEPPTKNNKLFMTMFF
jgi:hypothetical protein